SRCWIRTKAIPVVDGRCSKSCENASRPPAEAPTPTMGKAFPRRGGIREPGMTEPAFATEGAGAGLPAVLRGVLRGCLPPLFFAIPDPSRELRLHTGSYVSAWHRTLPCEDTIKS